MVITFMTLKVMNISHTENDYNCDNTVYDSKGHGRCYIVVM